MKQLSMGVSHTIRSLLGDTDAFYQDQDIPNIVPDVMETTIEMVEDLKVSLRPYWDVFKPPGWFL